MNLQLGLAGVGLDYFRPEAKLTSRAPKRRDGVRETILAGAASLIPPAERMGVVADTKATTPKKRPTEQFKRWLLAEVVEDVPGPQAKEGPRATLLVAGGLPDWGGLLLYPGIHPWHRGLATGALAGGHPLHSALDPLWGPADVQASG